MSIRKLVALAGLGLGGLGLGMAAGCATDGDGQDGAHRDHARSTTIDAAARPPARVVTQDIAEGIEAHIAEQTRRNDGVFVVPFEGEQLRLRLVRVHKEYLANLAPNEHFACVDLVNEDGRVFDVDFFLEGPAGDMEVTDTIVHKLNGKPYYVWEQADDGTWFRTAVDDADKPLLGVVEGRDAFRFSYAFTLPELENGSKMWLPLAESDRWQSVELVSTDTPVDWRVLRDREHGNAVLYFELDQRHSGRPVRLVYDVVRHEKAAYEDDSRPARYLNPERLVPDTALFREQAAQIVAGLDDDLMKARAIYDYVIDNMEYQKVGDQYGKGDALYACDALAGNCTDYHAYFIALSRAAGIPARFAIGAPIPSSRDEGGISGYHCWAEFYAQEKWWPIDASESDKYSALATYYFGRHPANRVELSRGRDLVVEPGPASGPINMLAYPVIEVDGRQVPLKPFFSFERTRVGAHDCEHCREAPRVALRN